MTALPSSSCLTTSSTGAMRVRPPSTRNVAVAHSSASPSVIAPIGRDDIGIGANSNRTSVTMLPTSNRTMIAACIAAIGVAAVATPPGASGRNQWSAVANASTGAIGVNPQSTTSVSTADKSARMSAIGPIGRDEAGIGALAAGSSGMTDTDVAGAGVSGAT